MDDNKNNSVEPGGALIPALRGWSRRNRSWKPAWTIQKIQGSPVLYETLSQKNQFYPNFTQSWLICSKKSTKGCLCGIITLTSSNGEKDAFLTSTVVIYSLITWSTNWWLGWFFNASHRTLKKKRCVFIPMCCLFGAQDRKVKLHWRVGTRLSLSRRICWHMRLSEESHVFICLWNIVHREAPKHKVQACTSDLDA